VRRDDSFSESYTKVIFPGITMIKLNKTIVLTASLLALTVLNTANADNVKILAADFRSSGGNFGR
jgi:hypothetical protein